MAVFFNKTAESCIIQSPRRLIFTHCSEAMEETGRYYADLVYNHGGTGILLKFEHKFFILTAQHVIGAHYEEPQNESPFFTHIHAKRGWEEITDLGFPIRGWRIGELIEESSDHIDINDIVLVELGDIYRYPDKFIDLDSHHAPKGIDIYRLYDGMLLVASGYPISENPIDYPYSEKFNCTTVLKKSIRLGICTKFGSSYCLKFPDGATHEALNGMSGGIVSNVMPKANQAEWVGMIQKGGGGLIHFYPASWIIPAIKRFRESSYYVIDPAQALSDPHFQATPEVIEGRNKFYQGIKSLTLRVLREQPRIAEQQTTKA